MHLRLRATATAAAAALLLACGGVRADSVVPVPPLTAPVVDLANTLTPEQTASLDAKLRAFSEARGSQVAVLIVPSTGPEDVEQFSIRVVDAWKLGRKDQDDGVLLLVARDDRKVRIEVGYGLEGALPDATANRVIEEYVVPRFRAGDYYGGIDAGVDRIIGVIEGESLPAPAARSRANGSGGLSNLLPLLLIFAVVGGSVLRRVFGRVGGAFATAGLVGVVTWFIAGVLLLSFVAAVVAFAFVLASGMGGGPGGRWHSGRRGGHGPPGGWGGGGFGGGGFGGGGFGGGGGGFGGGGASGGW
jgi:uncharacterized protein